MFGDIQNGVEHLPVRNAHIAALDREVWRDAFVLRLSEFHPYRIAYIHSLVLTGPECLSRFAQSEEAVRKDANSLGIHSSIIAGRIRKERGNYTILSDVVGQKQVRVQLEGANA